MDDIIVLPIPGIDSHPSLLPKEGLEKLNPNPAPKMKAKRTTKVKMPKVKKEKKMKTHKIKVMKAPTEGGKMKVKHPAHVHAHHPPWADMMCAAVQSLNEKHGSSMSAIKKYILSHYTIDIDANKITPMLKRGLKAATASKKLRHVKGHGLAGSFKLDVLGMKKGKVGKKIKKTKLVKKGGKTGGKKIVKKGKKMVKKTKKIKKTTKKITPVVGAQNIELLKPGMGKIKKMKKPKSESKKELMIKKVRKTQMKGKGIRKAPMPKKAVILNPPNPAILGGVTGMPIITLT
jgi:hypothetical protein